MKALLAVAVLALAIIAYSEPAVDNGEHIECPEDADPENATLVKDPYHCDRYYVCQGLEPIPMKCPKGLHFNDQLKTCDWPSNAKCKPLEPNE